MYYRLSVLGREGEKGAERNFPFCGVGEAVWCAAERRAVNGGGRYVPKESIRFPPFAIPPFLNQTAVATL